VHANVTEGQCAISCVRTDGECCTVNVISERKNVTVSVGGSWFAAGSIATLKNAYKI
jgi:hypothetical protein